MDLNFPALTATNFYISFRAELFICHLFFWNGFVKGLKSTGTTTMEKKIKRSGSEWRLERPKELAIKLSYSSVGLELRRSK